VETPTRRVITLALVGEPPRFSLTIPNKGGGRKLEVSDSGAESIIQWLLLNMAYPQHSDLGRGEFVCDS
jgi:hypothetical protein